MIEEIKKDITAFDKIQAGLADLKKRHLNVVVDVETKDGMIVALKGRRELREIRVDIEKVRVCEKEFYLGAGRKIDSMAKALTAEIEPLEKNYDNLIKEKERKEKAIEEAKILEEKLEAARKEKEIQDEKDRLAMIERKKFEDAQKLLEKERAEFEEAKFLVETEKRLIQEKADRDLREAREKIALMVKESDLRIELAQKDAKLKMELENRIHLEAQLARQKESDEIIAKAKVIQDKIDQEELAKKKAEVEAERKKQEEISAKKRQAELRKQNRMDGFKLLETFVGKYSADAEFDDVAKYIGKFLINSRRD